MSEPKPTAPIPTMLALDTFPEGKHKGKTLREVVAEDPTFVLWSVGRRVFRTTPKLIAEAKANQEWLASLDREEGENEDTFGGD